MQIRRLVHSQAFLFAGRVRARQPYVCQHFGASAAGSVRIHRREDERLGVAIGQKATVRWTMVGGFQISNSVYTPPLAYKNTIFGNPVLAFPTKYLFLLVTRSLPQHSQAISHLTSALASAHVGNWQHFDLCTPPSCLLHLLHSPRHHSALLCRRCVGSSPSSLPRCQNRNFAGS